MKITITFDSLPGTTAILKNYCSLDDNEISIAIESDKGETYAEMLITTEEAEQLIATVNSIIELTRKQNNTTTPTDEKNRTIIPTNQKLLWNINFQYLARRQTKTHSNPRSGGRSNSSRPRPTNGLTTAATVCYGRGNRARRTNVCGHPATPTSATTNAEATTASTKCHPSQKNH